MKVSLLQPFYNKDNPHLNEILGGCSMVVSPDSSILLDMENKVGIATVEIDPKKKYYKSGGFGNPPCSHFEYMKKGRRPWKYRPAGLSIKY